LNIRNTEEMQCKGGNRRVRPNAKRSMITATAVNPGFFSSWRKEGEFEVIHDTMPSSDRLWSLARGEVANDDFQSIATTRNEERGERHRAFLISKNLSGFDFGGFNQSRQ